MEAQLAPAQRNKIAAALAAFMELQLKDYPEDTKLDGEISVTRIPESNTFTFKYTMWTAMEQPPVRTSTYTKPDDMPQAQFEAEALELQQIISEVEEGV